MGHDPPGGPAVSVDWFAGAHFLRLEARRQRERREALGITVEQVAALASALRIFDRPTIAAHQAMLTADTLEELAAVFEQRARDATTPAPRVLP